MEATRQREDGASGGRTHSGIRILLRCNHTFEAVGDSVPGHWLGLVGGSAQAVQGLGILGVPFSFLSSAFVPVQSMPVVLQVIAEYQPLTLMVDAVRGLVLGEPVTATTAHSLTFSVVGSVLWSIRLLAVFFPLAVRRYRRG